MNWLCYWLNKDCLSPSRRREAPCEGTNSPRLFTPGETKALAKSKVHQISRAWPTNLSGWSSSLISKIWRTVMDSEHWLVKFKICCYMTNDDFNWQILHENNLLFALQYFVRLQKTLTAFKAICSIKSLINDKKAERLAKRRERRRQRLLEETAEERELARLEKRREAWKKKTAEAKGKHCWSER